MPYLGLLCCSSSWCSTCWVLGTQGNPKPFWKELAFPDSVSRQGAVERKSTVLWEATRPSRCFCQLVARKGGQGRWERRERLEEQGHFQGNKIKHLKLYSWLSPFPTGEAGTLGAQKGHTFFSTSLRCSLQNHLSLHVPPVWHPHPCAVCSLCSTHIHVLFIHCSTHIRVPCAHCSAPTSMCSVHTMQHVHSCAMHAKFDLGFTLSVLPLTRAEELTPPGPGPPLMVMMTVLGCFYWASIVEQARKIIFFLFPACPFPPHTHCMTLVR